MVNLVFAGLHCLWPVLYTRRQVFSEHGIISFFFLNVLIHKNVCFGSQIKGRSSSCHNL